MEYKIIEKSHVYELLYPIVAKALGMKNLFMRGKDDMLVRYYSNSCCTGDDNADNAMSRLTVECVVHNRGTVMFVPDCVAGHVPLPTPHYGVYVEDNLVMRLNPTEWELVRPKVYADFTEYFTEFSKAIVAYESVAKHIRIAGQGMSPRQFIVNHYGTFVRSFRYAIHTNLFKFSAMSMVKPVEIMFNINDDSDIHEHAVLTKTVNGRLMLIATSLN